MGKIQAGGTETQSPYIIRLYSNVNSTLPKGDKGRSEISIYFKENATKFIISTHGDFRAAFPEKSLNLDAVEFEDKIKLLVRKSIDWQLVSIRNSESNN